MTDGLTLSGGEPFAQAEDCLALARAAPAHGLNAWKFFCFLRCPAVDGVSIQGICVQNMKNFCKDFKQTGNAL